MRELFNPYQLDAVIDALTAFEKSIRETKRWLDGTNEDGILYKKSLKSSIEQRNAAQEQIEIALKEINILVKK